jgi:hypothetical protein
MEWGFWSKEVDADVHEAMTPLDGTITHLSWEDGSNVTVHGMVSVAGSEVRHNHR